MFKIYIFLGAIDSSWENIVDTFYSQVCPTVGSEISLNSSKINGTYTVRRSIPLLFSKEGIVIGSEQTVFVVI